MSITQDSLPTITEQELVSWLRQQSWSNFASDLTKFYDERGYLTERQVASASGFRERQQVRQAERQSAPAVAVTEALPPVYPLPVGTFTMELPTGHRTFEARIQPADASFAPGEMILSFLSGSDNESDYTGFAFVKGTPESPRLVAWKRFRESTDLLNDAEALLANPNADNVLIARRCIACGRKLTRPSSVHANIGPECAKRFGGI